MPRATATLPPRPLGFTGRSAELERLLGQLAPGGPGGEAVLIFAVTGMGGIGKTALAVEAAHRACGEGWFPGGTLFVDFRGYDENPVTADQAVLALLEAMGVRGPKLPSTVAQQYDLYHALLAGQRKRTLLILDNASDPAQFLGLLPGTDRHRVLITSRDRPDALPVRLIDLETLAPDDSVALLTRALRDADERDDRAAREPEALHELASLCGNLPLALRIAAAMLRRRRHREIASLVDEIKQAGDPTVVLDKGSRGTDQYGRSLALRPVLETSYHRLSPEQARLLRLLSLAPGADTSTEAVAALTDLVVDEAIGLLEDLAAAGLVTPVPAGGDVRWRLHDLVRAFAAGLMAEHADLSEEGETARERLLRFYLRWARAADDRLRWLPGMVEPERFADRAQALAWLDGERAGLVAAVLWAPERRHAPSAVQLGFCLAEYFDWHRNWDDKITVGRAAQQAAHSFGARRTEAGAWTILGLALREVGRAEEAIDAHNRSRDIYHAVEDLRSEAMVWNNLGLALRDAGRAEESIEAHSRARDLHRNTGDRHGEAMAWNNLGNALREAGRPEEAIDAHYRAHDLYEATEDRHRRATALHNLGNALMAKGRNEEAVEMYGKALGIYQEFEDWYRVGHALEALAFAHTLTGHHSQARTYHLRSADAYTRANAPTEAAIAQSSADALT